jgi:hypothetical protein
MPTDMHYPQLSVTVCCNVISTFIIADCRKNITVTRKQTIDYKARKFTQTKYKTNPFIYEKAEIACANYRGNSDAPDGTGSTTHVGFGIIF